MFQTFMTQHKIELLENVENSLFHKLKVNRNPELYMYFFFLFFMYHKEKLIRVWNNMRESKWQKLYNFLSLEWKNRQSDVKTCQARILIWLFP